MSAGEMITIGAPYGGEGKPDGKINVGGQMYDLGPFFAAIADIGEAEKIAVNNPYSMEPFRKIGRARKVLVGALHQALPANIIPIMRPLVQHAAGPMLDAAREAIKLRMQASHRLMQHPTQTIPLTLDNASFVPGSTATFVIQNPYQGSGGGVYNTNALWAITGMESGSLAQIGGLTITSAVFAGHDYVQAALNGLQSTTGVGAATGASRGWSWSIFASDKRREPHNVFSPWNLQGAAGIIGAIMRETGTVTLSLTNIANLVFTTGFAGSFHVHVKASLCGSPFDPQDIHKTFVPFNQQLSASHSLAAHLPNHMQSVFQTLGQQVNQIRGLDTDLEATLEQPFFFPR